MASEQNINDAIAGAHSKGYSEGRYEATLSAIAIIAKASSEASRTEIDDFAVGVVLAIAEAELT